MTWLSMYSAEPRGLCLLVEFLAYTSTWPAVRPFGLLHLRSASTFIRLSSPKTDTFAAFAFLSAALGLTAGPAAYPVLRFVYS